MVTELKNTSFCSTFSRVCNLPTISRTFLVLFSKIWKFECNTTSDWLKCMVLASQKLYYLLMLLNIEKSEEQDWECSQEWLVNSHPAWPFLKIFCKFCISELRWISWHWKALEISSKEHFVNCFPCTKWHILLLVLNIQIQKNFC